MVGLRLGRTPLVSVPRATLFASCTFRAVILMLAASLFDPGALAQLVERFHGMEEVRSSILLSSTFLFSLATQESKQNEAGGSGGARQGRRSCNTEVLVQDP